jgi:hypothetical protein
MKIAVAALVTARLRSLIQGSTLFDAGSDKPRDYNLAKADALIFVRDGLILLRVIFRRGRAVSGFGLGLVPLSAPHVGHVLRFRLSHVVAGDFRDAFFDFDDFPIGRFRVAAVAALRESDFKSLRVLFLFGHLLFSSLAIY